MALAQEKGLRDNMGYSWTDSSGKRFLFEFDEDKSSMIKVFQTTVLQCMYEATYHRSHQEASEQQLMQFMT